MIRPDFEPQLRDDVDTLREICAGLDRLEREACEVHARGEARSRGYFTPDEEDRIRQMLLAYRNYRLALYEVINRYADYEELAASADQMRAFMLGFAAALTLYAKSLTFIRIAEGEPLYRRKLNEPDAKFDLAAGFFDDVMQGYSSLHHLLLITHAQQFWLRRRRLVRKMKLVDDAGWAWVCGVIRLQRAAVRKLFFGVLRRRLRHDWRALWQFTFKPFKRAGYGLRALVADRLGGLRLTTHYRPTIDGEVLARLRPLLRTGDVLLVRAERKLTSALLPGFWAHAAIYVDRPGDLERLGIDSHPHIQKHRHTVPHDGGPFGRVIEAISPRVAVNPLEKCLCADHVAVLRPNVSPAELAAALAEAFGHVGKPYDFEFDFNVSTRIVCTELIYRSFHRRGEIEFALVKRLGRFTLTGNDIVNQFLDTPTTQPAPFRLVTLVLKHADDRAHFLDAEDALAALRKIRSGLRPTDVPHFA